MDDDNIEPYVCNSMHTYKDIVHQSSETIIAHASIYQHLKDLNVHTQKIKALRKNNTMSIAVIINRLLREINCEYEELQIVNDSLKKDIISYNEYALTNYHYRKLQYVHSDVLKNNLLKVFSGFLPNVNPESLIMIASPNAKTAAKKLDLARSDFDLLFISSLPVNCSRVLENPNTPHSYILNSADSIIE